MDVTRLPFNQLIGLQPASLDSGFAVTLPAGTQYTNHLGTVHGSALLAVAEAGSGAFVIKHFGHIEGIIPVVRKLEAKFRKPANGAVAARVITDAGTTAECLTELERRRRVLVSIAVEVMDGTGDVVLQAQVEWFITLDNRR